MKSLTGEFMPGLLVVAAMVAGTFFLGGDLPDQVPVHFGVDGTPDRYAAAGEFVWYMPAIMIGLMVLISVLMRLSPKRWSMPNSRRLLGQMYLGVGLLLGGIHFGTLLDPAAGERFVFIVAVAGALFLLVFGNVLAKSERNFFIGLRLPWTIASDNNWSATHRLTGRLMVLAGVAMGVLAFVQPSMGLFVALLVTPILAGCLYSFYFYVARERRTEME